MGFEHKNNSGTLFKNDHKETENQPDYKGECMVNGKKMQMASWLKQGKNGTYMSFSFSEPYVKPDSKPAPMQGVDHTTDDDIPF